MTKRLFFAVFYASIMTSLVFAQTGLRDFTMRGVASQEMRAEGFVGAHPSLPLNSNVIITNPQNGRSIEITITGRINPSQNRIIDLSFAVINSLGMRAGEQIILTVRAPRPTAPVSRQPEQIVDLLGPRLLLDEPIISARQNPVIQEQPEILTEEQNFPDVGQLSNIEEAFSFFARAGDSVEFLAWLMAMTIQAREAREAREERMFRE